MVMTKRCKVNHAYDLPALLFANIELILSISSKLPMTNTHYNRAAHSHKEESTVTPTTTNDTDINTHENRTTCEASGSRGPCNAAVFSQPELQDSSRHSNFPTVFETQKGSTAYTPQFPLYSSGSRGPVSAEVQPPPELADTPRHFRSSGRGTDKGHATHSPKDTVGAKSLATNAQATTGSKNNQQSRRLARIRKRKSKISTPSADNENNLLSRIGLDAASLAHDKTAPLPEAACNAAIYDAIHLLRYGIEIPQQSSSSYLPSKRISSVEQQALTVSKCTPQRTTTDMRNSNTRFAVQWNINGFTNNLAD